MNQVRVRFAPSPTGYLHIGGLRTALFNYLYARHHGGQYILRIEDTDRTRYVEGALENLLDVLQWAGLQHDEGPVKAGDDVQEKGNCGPYIQSDRVKAGIYQKYIDQLLEEGKAYYCFCSKERLEAVREAQKAAGETPRYDGHCRNIPLDEARRRAEAGEDYVIRLRLPENTEISWKDAIKGEIAINTAELDDQVLIKSDGFPTYHFAVVIDDHLMGVTHVVRGEEWISSTPKHLYLYDCFGWDRPSYVHLPTVLGQDHKKLSKRNGDVSVELFIQRGYLKEALINYIALLGWSPKGNEEKLSLEELEAQFDFDRVANTGGIFDEKKLMWLNQQYIQALSAEECSVYLRTFLEKEGCIDASYPQEKLLLLAETYGNRIERFDQVPTMLAHFFTPAVELKYTEKAQEALKDQQGAMLVRRFSQSLDEEGFSSEWAHTIVSRIQKETGIKGKNLWFPIRAAVVGDTSGPDFGNTLCVLGEEEIRARLERVEREFLREE